LSATLSGASLSLYILVGKAPELILRLSTRSAFPFSPFPFSPSLASIFLPPANPSKRIYLLNLFLAFLQPKFDPSLAADIAEAEVEEGAPGLPTSTSPSARNENYGEMQDGEFRPFIRRLPEFKFW
jgi:hypothetical protein